MQSPFSNYIKYRIYANAHQDDWIFFRGEIGWEDVINPFIKTLFIYTTAGDGGRTDGYWESRERGAMAAIRSMLPKIPVSSEIISCNGHPIVRYSCRNTRSYFMRLPDGNGSGDGFPATNNTSLQKLMNSNLPITAVDKSTTYETQQNFFETLVQIIALEKPSSPLVDTPWINVSDYDTKINPGNHSDHIYTSLTLKQKNIGGTSYSKALYVAYETKNKKPPI